MEKIRYIDLLLTLRSEYLKLKDNFDGILDDIEIKKPFRKEGVSLSKEKKFKSIVQINYDVPCIQLLIDKERKYSNKSTSSRYDIKINLNPDTIIPEYSLLQTHNGLNCRYPNFTSTFSSSNVMPIVESDLFRLSNEKKENSYETAFDDKVIETGYYGFPLVKIIIDSEGYPNGGEVVFKYDFQKNELFYKAVAKHSIASMVKSDVPDSWLYDGEPLPQRKFGSYHIATILSRSVSDYLIPDNWRKFLEKHLVTYDKRIEIDSTEYREKYGDYGCPETSCNEKPKKRLLVFDGESNEFSKYKIRL